MSRFARRLAQASGNTSSGQPPDTGGTPDMVDYVDLYQPGDTVNDALSRLTSPSIVTFPAGVFLLSDFPYNGGAIDCKKTFLRGIIGAGSGDFFDESQGTVFKMVPNSSTMAGTPAAPAQGDGGTTQVWVIKCVDAQGDVRFEDFQIVGTEQGHNYHGLYVYHPDGDVTIRNVKVSGVPGDDNTAPGETFAITAYQGNLGQTLIEDCEVDGRRAVGGEWFGAGGITCGQSIGAVVNRCSAHHHRASSSFVFYQSFDATLNDCIWGTTDPLQSSLVGVYPTSEVSHVVTSGIVHNNCQYWHSITNQSMHITFSNNHAVCQYAGWPPRSADDGTLHVVNPSWNDIWGDSMLYIQSWRTGIDGTFDDDSMVTPPLVTQSDGTTHITYKWVHIGTQTIT